MANKESFSTLDEATAYAAGLVKGRKEGKIAGLRQAADLLVQWGSDARENGDEFEGKANEEAAESLRQIADIVEEEG